VVRAEVVADLVGHELGVVRDRAPGVLEHLGEAVAVAPLQREPSQAMPEAALALDCLPDSIMVSARGTAA